MRSVLIHTYHTEKEDMPKDFRTELRQFILAMRRTVSKDTHTRGEQFDTGNPPLSLPIIDECVSECSPSPILSMFYRALINMEWSLMARADNLFCLHVNHFDWRDDSLVIFFYGARKI